jgi:hypothetical protein
MIPNAKTIKITVAIVDASEVDPESSPVSSRSADSVDISLARGLRTVGSGGGGI